MAVEHSFAFIPLPEVQPARVYVTSQCAFPARVARASKIDLAAYSPIRWLGRVVAISAAFLSQRVGGVVVGHRLTWAGGLIDSGGSDRNYRNLFQLKRALCLLRRCLHQMRHFQTIFMLSMHIHRDRQSQSRKRDAMWEWMVCVFVSSSLTLWPGESPTLDFTTLCDFFARDCFTIDDTAFTADHSTHTASHTELITSLMFCEIFSSFNYRLTRLNLNFTSRCSWNYKKKWFSIKRAPWHGNGCARSDSAENTRRCCFINESHLATRRSEGKNLCDELCVKYFRVITARSEKSKFTRNIGEEVNENNLWRIIIATKIIEKCFSLFLASRVLSRISSQGAALIFSA